MGSKVGRVRCPLIRLNCTLGKERRLLNFFQGTQGCLGGQRFVGQRGFPDASLETT